jgi:hypothetical protein
MRRAASGRSLSAPRRGSEIHWELCGRTLTTVVRPRLVRLAPHVSAEGHRNSRPWRGHDAGVPRPGHHSHKRSSGLRSNVIWSNFWCPHSCAATAARFQRLRRGRVCGDVSAGPAGRSAHGGLHSPRRRLRAGAHWRRCGITHEAAKNCLYASDRPGGHTTAWVSSSVDDRRHPTHRHHEEERFRAIKHFQRYAA